MVITVENTVRIKETEHVFKETNSLLLLPPIINLKCIIEENYIKVERKNSP